MRKILIIDDEKPIRDVLNIALIEEGYEPYQASNGEKGLELCKTNKPDIVLTDVMMPGMDGFQVLEELRAFSRLPVIAFSARSENGPRALELGANTFLAKPFDVDDLVRRTQRMLDNQW